MGQCSYTRRTGWGKGTEMGTWQGNEALAHTCPSNQPHHYDLKNGGRFDFGGQILRSVTTNLHLVSCGLSFSFAQSPLRIPGTDSEFHAEIHNSKSG